MLSEDCSLNERRFFGESGCKATHLRLYERDHHGKRRQGAWLSNVYFFHVLSGLLGHLVPFFKRAKL